MRDLYTQLAEDEECKTVGESIAIQFYYGNFSDSVAELRELNTTAVEFVDFLEGMAEELDTDLASMFGGHFSPTFFVNLGSEQL